MARKSRKRKNKEVAAVDKAAVSSISSIRAHFTNGNPTPVVMPSDIQGDMWRLTPEDRLFKTDAAVDSWPLGSSAREAALLAARQMSISINTIAEGAQRAVQRAIMQSEWPDARWRPWTANFSVSLTPLLRATESFSAHSAAMLNGMPIMVGDFVQDRPLGAQLVRAAFDEYILVNDWIDTSTITTPDRLGYMIVSKQVSKINFSELGKQILAASATYLPSAQHQLEGLSASLSEFVAKEAEITASTRNHLHPSMYYAVPVGATISPPLESSSDGVYYDIASRIIGEWRQSVRGTVKPDDEELAEAEVRAAFEALFGLCGIKRRPVVRYADPLTLKSSQSTSGPSDLTAMMALLSNMTRAMMYSSASMRKADRLFERFSDNARILGATPRRQISEAIMREYTSSSGGGSSGAAHAVSDLDSLATFYSVDSIAKAEVELEWSCPEPYSHRWLAHKLVRFIFRRVSAFSMSEDQVSYCFRPMTYSTMETAPDTRRVNATVGNLSDRLHSTTGPAVEWNGGLKIYVYKGVPVPPFVITNPEGVTAQEALSHPNAEVRRVMLEVIGPERMVKELNPVLLHEDNSGKLWEVTTDRVTSLRDNGTMFSRAVEPMRIVEVINRTPNPDGSFSHYWLAVPPSTNTALEGVAWTFGLSADQYKPIAET